VHEESSHIVLPFEPHRTRFTVNATVARQTGVALEQVFYRAFEKKI